MRICSFLPAATEIVFALGLGDSLMGVTFECNYPPEAKTKPAVIHSRLPQGLPAGEIDRCVSEFVSRGESIYRVDADQLHEIRPDLIIAQDLCHVCAASPNDFATILAGMSPTPAVLTLSPKRLADVWNDILLVGRATGRTRQAMGRRQPSRGGRLPWEPGESHTRAGPPSVRADRPGPALPRCEGAVS